MWLNTEAPEYHIQEGLSSPRGQSRILLSVTRWHAHMCTHAHTHTHTTQTHTHTHTRTHTVFLPLLDFSAGGGYFPFHVRQRSRQDQTGSLMGFLEAKTHPLIRTAPLHSRLQLILIGPKSFKLFGLLSDELEQCVAHAESVRERLLLDRNPWQVVKNRSTDKRGFKRLWETLNECYSNTAANIMRCWR